MKKWLFQEASHPTIVTKVIDLIILNFIFIISCIPIITIGASLTSLYHVTLKMTDSKKDYFVWRDFIKCFKQNFIQSTTAMGILLSIVALLAGMAHLINLFGEPTVIVTMPFLVGVTVIGFVTIYLFPLLAFFENTIGQMFKNALIISFHQMAKSIVLFLIALIIIIVIPLFMRQAWFLWLLMAFSLTAYLQSLILRRVFEAYQVGITRNEQKEKA